MIRPGRIFLAFALAVAPVGGAAGQALPVPFVPQGELLCGGASAAMVLRYHGLRGVHAEDFAPLVRPDEGGIRTGDLARAVADRLPGMPSGDTAGSAWSAEEGPGTLAGLAASLAADQPTIVLLGEGGDRYHYVTVVGLETDHILVHDPWIGPERRLPLDDFARRWREAGDWRLVVKPPASRGGSAVGSAAPPVDPLLADASERFRAGDWAGAVRLAEKATRQPGADDRAWRILAVSRYLAGDPEGSLEAWRRAGGVELDLVRVEGLKRTRHPVVHHLTGFEPGGALTADDLLRARRRLAALPAAATTGISWRPVDSERAEVEVTVVELPLLPTDRISLVAMAARAAARREASVTLASPWGTGSALVLEGRWTRAAERLGVTLAAPGALRVEGITSLSLVRRVERYPGDVREGLTRAALRHDEWRTGRVAWWAEVAADEWLSAGTGASLGAGLQWRDSSDRLALSVEGRAARPGAGADFGSGVLDVAWRSSTLQRGWTGSARAGVAATTSAAPRLAWPGAGTGNVRTHRLRAHPLDRGDVVEGPAFGRTLVSAGAEAVRWSGWTAPFRLGAAAFLDAAWTARRQEEGTTAHADVGLGLRFALPGAPGLLGIDGAVGLRDGATALSLSWRAAAFP